MGGPEGLHILSLSVHGLVRGRRIELGRDADTGGQVQYVVEQARALGGDPRVRWVDLVTRRIEDRRVDPSYAVSREAIGEGAGIVRIPFGPRRYLHKERLWPHIDSLVDQVLLHVRGSGGPPDLVHGHYADGGYVGAQLAKLLGVPFVFTGHSLGRIKRARLLDKGARAEAVDRQYAFPRRIEGEEIALEEAALVITSTTQEIEEQYALYDHYQPDRMEVIPPGVDLRRFRPPRPGEGEPRISRELGRFLRDPRKPMILAMARPDEKKNFSALIEAYAETPGLRRRANLVLVAGNRDDIGTMAAGARTLLGGILLQIDRYDLYGSVAYPKHHVPEDVPDLYRLAARSRGVFANVAVTEPFGLTLIEAAASGLPVVATRDGGPMDIVRTCGNGLLVDPHDCGAIASALLEVLEGGERWDEWSECGVKRSHARYTWESHVRRYLGEVEHLLGGRRAGYDHLASPRSKLPGVDRILVTDIDNTLTGDDEGVAALMARLEGAGERVGFAIATGRGADSALEILERVGVRTPDILITSVGTEIYYGTNLTPDRSWERHIDWHWRPEEVREAMRGLEGVRPQPPERQSRFKISYYLDPEKAPSMRKVQRFLRQRGLRVKAISSFEAYLDVIPIRASPGLAVRFLCLKWNFPPERLLIAGDSGSDEDMLSGDTLGVVVGNYSPELEHLRGMPRIYFARGRHAWGILEGMEEYGFLERTLTLEEHPA